jgi:hypothetical protein
MLIDMNIQAFIVFISTIFGCMLHPFPYAKAKGTRFLFIQVKCSVLFEKSLAFREDLHTSWSYYKGNSSTKLCSFKSVSIVTLTRLGSAVFWLDINKLLPLILYDVEYCQFRF